MTKVDRILQSWRIRKIRPYLKPGARVLDIGSVDGVLFSQIPGMSLEEHHGYEAGHITRIFPDPPFELVRRTLFQLGLNNLFIFRRQGNK